MKLVENRLPTWTLFRPDGFSFCRYLPDRPRYMHETTYRRYLAALRLEMIEHLAGFDLARETREEYRRAIRRYVKEERKKKPGA